MRLYFDLNLGYLVSTPGQADPLSGLAFKAGDEASVEVQFGRSNIFSKPDVPAWRSELLATSSNITIGLKLDTDFTDGTLLAGESDYTSGSSNCYVFALNLNTVEINTALGRDGGGTELASVDCNFEVTYQSGGTGGWNSSTLPIPAIVYHDVLLGDETAPSNAEDHNYPTKSDVIVWYSTRVGLTGGGATKLDGIATTALTAGYAAALLDESATPDTLRTYRLEAGTDAESSPDVIRPDDYGVSNQKIWRLYGGGHDAVTLSASVTDVLTITGQDITADDAGADKGVFWDDSAGKLTHFTFGSGLTMTGTELTAPKDPYWIEVVLTAAGAAIESGTKVAMLTHMQAGTITGFKIVCDPAEEPSAAAVQVDLNSVNLSTGAATSRLSAVASIATGANISTGGTISGTQTVAVGDQSSFDIDQGSDGKELRALVQITPS